MLAGDHNLSQSGLEWGVEACCSANLLLQHPTSPVVVLLLLFFLLLSVLSLHLEVSAFSSVIHQCFGLSKSTQALQLVTANKMHWAHCMYTHKYPCSVSFIHYDWLPLKAEFSSSAFCDQHYSACNQRLPVSSSLLSFVCSLVQSHPLNHTSHYFFCRFHDNSGRKYYPVELSQ